MEKPTEDKETFTILTKTGCRHCKTLKKVLEIGNFKYVVVDCDDFILEDREQFIKKIKEYTNINDIVYFPIVFYEGKYLEEPIKFIDSLIETF